MGLCKGWVARERRTAEEFRMSLARLRAIELLGGARQDPAVLLLLLLLLRCSKRDEETHVSQHAQPHARQVMFGTQHHWRFAAQCACRAHLYAFVPLVRLGACCLRIPSIYHREPV